MILHSSLLWGFTRPPSPGRIPNPKGYILLCRMDVHPSAWGASAFCVYETLVETYGKDLANSKRSTPLSESRARNLSSPVFVVRQQYGYEALDNTAEARSIRSLRLQTA
jgi:hypothetical protein